MRIEACKVGHFTNPLGYDIGNPVFSWKTTDTSAKKQATARICISTEPDMGTLIHDTGFVADLNSRATPVQLLLDPCTRYFWQAEVRTEEDETAQSAIQWFETGKMDERWNAKWIGCDDGEPRLPIFTRKIEVRKTVKHARLYVCGLGLYEASICGNRVGDEYFTPYCNNYNSWLQYQTFDITELLNRFQSDSVIEILLGNGWYKGRFGFSEESQNGFYGHAWKLIAELKAEYLDGTKETIGTDENWSVRRSDITFSIGDDSRYTSTNEPGMMSPLLSNSKVTGT